MSLLALIKRIPMQMPKIITILVISVFILAGCNYPPRLTPMPSSFSTTSNDWKATPSPFSDHTPISQLSPTMQPSEVLSQTLATETEQPDSQGETPESLNPTLDPKPKVFLHPGLSPNLISQLNFGPDQITNDENLAQYKIQMSNLETGGDHQINWIYVLVSPFYNIPDALSFEELSALWQQGLPTTSDFKQILIMPETLSAMAMIMGEPNPSAVKVLNSDDLMSRAVSDEKFLAILPWEDLVPQWKILRLDDQSPIAADFDPSNYPLTLHIWCEGSSEDFTCDLPMRNYNPELRTVLIMTGVTAMTRATAYRMAVMGNAYPGKDIQSWLSSADITHISNEVPFAANCPDPDPVAPSLIFCSAPERIELLDSVGTDIIELSGNHMLDYGLDAIKLTLEMYENRGWSYFAGGWNTADAQSAALFTHNGNNLAFIGCNNVGPYSAFAGTSKPGATPCGDLKWMVQEIQQLRSESYLPIATFQYAEDYTAYPTSQMVRDFELLADAGAIIVNGSQAHTPKLMTFYNGTFLHFGLGNLFFDQMDMLETRQEFIDRLIFYDGKLVSVELLTAMLEEYARPRPMVESERETFLTRIFSAAINFLE